MKRIVTVFLAVTILVICISGCGNSQSGNTSTTNPTSNIAVTSSAGSVVASSTGSSSENDSESSTCVEAKKSDFTYYVDGETVLLKKYTGTDPYIILPKTMEGKPVTKIGDDCFWVKGDYTTPWGNKTLQGVIIPEGYTSIGRNAFNDCTELQEIELPDTMTDLGCGNVSGPFSGCEKLSSINLPDSITNIAADTFSKCKSLTEVTIPAGAKICTYIFSYCTGLQKVVIKSGVTDEDGNATLPQGLFSDCTNLKETHIPASITGIDTACGDFMYNCSSIQTIYGASGSFAEKWAAEEKINFKAE